MSSWWVQRSLRHNADRLRAAKAELAVMDEQVAALGDEAADLELRALMSDAPFDRSEARDAAGHAEANARHRQRLRDRIAALEVEQDQLLDRLNGRP